jgi:hypothetical protein
MLDTLTMKNPLLAEILIGPNLDRPYRRINSLCSTSTEIYNILTGPRRTGYLFDVSGASRVFSGVDCMRRAGVLRPAEPAPGQPAKFNAPAKKWTS